MATIHIAAFFAIAFSTSAASVAQTTARTEADLARARELFQEALSLEVAGDFTSALGKLQQVSKVRLTPQVRYHLARCKENLGRLTEALGDYRVAATEARDAGLSELEEFERARVALDARVPRLRVSLRAASSGASVELDGVQVGTVALSEPIPVDPGLRRLVLRDGARVVQSQTVMATEGQTTDVVFEGDARALPGPPAAAGIERSNAGAPPWAYAAGAVGVVGAASAVTLWIVRSEAMSDLDSACEDRVCPVSMRSTADRGKFASWAAPVAGTIGAIGVGFAVWGFWPREQSGKRDGSAGDALRLTVNAGAQFAGVRLSSEF